MKAWYFSEPDCRLRYGDNRQIKAGVTHKVDCKPILCRAGLHGSIYPLDALDYAPAPFVWRVELGGKIVRGDDKAVATERTYLWGYDATEVLRKFARMCALDVAHLWNAPDVVLQYLKTGDESLRAVAWSAARSAAWSAARSAGSAALSAAWSAESAAWSAALSAAWSAARSAALSAGSAARSAARSAESAARGKQNARLYRMLMEGRR